VAAAEADVFCCNAADRPPQLIRIGIENGAKLIAFE
jgi:hypothetical protein